MRKAKCVGVRYSLDGLLANEDTDCRAGQHHHPLVTRKEIDKLRRGGDRHIVVWGGAASDGRSGGST